MAAPLSAADLLAALRAEGCKVQEYRSWRTHRRPTSTGAFGPINGVMIHHTVTSGTDSSVALCYNGHSDLPGPLCHGVIAKDGTIYLVSAGRANHAGPGDDDVLRMVQNESYNRDSLLAPNEANTDGNARFYGFECINLGNGKDPWPAAQRDAIVRASAAILRAYGGPAKGWTAKSVIGHKEWQPGKIDPRTGTGGVDVSPPVLRKLIDERLAHPASWTPGATTAPSKPATSPTAPKEDDMPSAKEIAAAVMEYQIDDPRTTGTKYVTVKSVLWWAGADSAQANTKVESLEKQVKHLTELVNRLLAANTQG
ncbi:N-acetylmuramoyl-L-alanine amidase [Streptomyces rochei]|uniref:peptidoglycan recognition protein family protein n=1 Tax=Streptomyces rochei TaxID=1928 RepID=UPI0036C5E04D